MEALVIQWLQTTCLGSIYDQVEEEGFRESLLVYIEADTVSILEFDS
jgi:hypothetical protein